jgi:N-formylglutamate deformylase
VDNVLNFKQGRTPLLISMPHAGLRLTPAVKAGLIPEAQSLPDTDWHIPLLYDFAEQLGASTLSAEYSRFVIDLNRPSDDTPRPTCRKSGAPTTARCKKSWRG